MTPLINTVISCSEIKYADMYTTTSGDVVINTIDVWEAVDGIMSEGELNGET